MAAIAAWHERRPYSGSMLGLDTGQEVEVIGVQDRHDLDMVRKALDRLYSAEQPVSISCRPSNDSTTEQIRVPLSDLLSVEAPFPCDIAIPPLDRLEASRSVATLHWIIGFLRSEEGCPWDRKQTYESLRDKLLEETHEAIEAIGENDPPSLRSELGDLLLLIALYAQIAEEADDFTIEDVYASVNEKLVRRHPHVFGGVEAETPEDVLRTWKSVKQREGRAVTSETHRYDQLPSTLSPIQRIRMAESIQLPSDEKMPKVECELGDQLLGLIMDCHDRGIDPEAAIERAYRRSR